jgi:aspartyl protease family protein
MEDGDKAEDGLPVRVGRGMLVAFWALLLLFLFFFFRAALERITNPNREVRTSISAQGVKEVTLLRNRQGHYLASGTINGYPVTFLLDTGATDVAISGDLARRLDLPHGAAMPSQTAAGTVMARATHLERVALGGIELRDIPASILEEMEGEEVLLGMSFLKQLEFTQRGETLILRQR